MSPCVEWLVLMTAFGTVARIGEPGLSTGGRMLYANLGDEALGRRFVLVGRDVYHEDSRGPSFFGAQWGGSAEHLPFLSESAPNSSVEPSPVWCLRRNFCSGRYRAHLLQRGCFHSGRGAYCTSI